MTESASSRCTQRIWTFLSVPWKRNSSSSHSAQLAKPKPKPSLYSLPMQKTDGSCRMTVNYCKLIWLQLFMPDVGSLLGQHNTSPRIWHTAIDVTNTFLPVPVRKNHQKQLAFSWWSQQYTITVLLPGFIYSPVLCYNTVQRHLDLLSLPQGIPLVHCIDDSNADWPKWANQSLVFLRGCLDPALASLSDVV